MQLNFGQPDDGVIQMAYVVPDIRAAMRHWSEHLKVGPFFLIEGFAGVNPRYRGKPSRASVKLAMGFAGHMQIELIQPADDHPSVYRETIDATGHGFHHWGLAARHFDADLKRFQAQGWEPAFECEVPTGGRVAYLDTQGALPGFVELIELGPFMEEVFSRFYAASIGWDGADPVRTFA
ncbi:MAG: VOC family protein [Hyphomonadaceae bacterium]|nr:VOC family protein [Hyphomonadaceae bacterium]